MSRSAGAEPDQISFGQELLRKLTHMGALAIPSAYWALGLSKSTMLSIMIPATVLMYIIDISRLRNWPLWNSVAVKAFGRMIRQHEQAGDFTGATYILTSVCLTVGLYSRPIAVAALAFIVVGDTFAALVGRRWGRHGWFKGKTVEGSFACLIGTMLVALAAPGISLPILMLGALVAAVVEALPLGIDDNITVPILSGLVMTLANA